MVGCREGGDGGAGDRGFILQGHVVSGGETRSGKWCETFWIGGTQLPSRVLLWGCGESCMFQARMR